MSRISLARVFASLSEEQAVSAYNAPLGRSTTMMDLDVMAQVLISNDDRALGARKVFACDVRKSEAQQEARRQETEISMASLDGFASTDPVLDHLLPYEMQKILAEVARVNYRAPSWILARLEGLTDIEIAEEWGCTPQNVKRWGYTYSHQIKAIFAKYLETPVDLSLDGLSETHASLVRVGRGSLRNVP